jgi:flagellar protein FliL
MSEVIVKKNSGNLLKIIIIILLLLILIGGGILGGFIIAGRSNTSPDTPPKPKAIVEATFSVDELLLNLADPDSRRFIRTNIVLAYDSKNKKLATELESKKAIIRDSISYVLRGKKASDFTQKGADDIKKEIINIVNPHLKNGRLTNIYYYDIIIQ